MGECKLVPVRGEFESTDWQVGLFAEKDRISNLSGENGNICSVRSFDYKGSVENLKGYDVLKRMGDLKDRGSVGEIVRIKKPIGYLRFYTKLFEVSDSNIVNKNQMRLSCSNARGRYCLLELKNNNPIQYYFLRGYDTSEDAKKEIFGILRSRQVVLSDTSFCFHYIYDTETGKAYRCIPEIERLENTTRESDALNVITPIYRYIYYGYAESKK